MRQIRTVFAFTLRDMLHKKAFRISTILILVLVLILCLLPRLIGSGGGEEETETAPEARSKVLYYLDEDGCIPGGPEALERAFSSTRVEVRADAELQSLREEIAEDGDLALVRVTMQDGAPFLNILSKDVLSGPDAGTAVEALSRAYVAQMLADQGVSEEMVALTRTDLAYAVEIAGRMDVSGLVLGLLLTLLMFFAVYYYGVGVATSIATEKATRVMETLVVSCKPSRILLGKCLAMGTLGLAQMAGLIAFTALCYTLLVPEGFTIMGMPLSIASMTLPSALLMLLYFLLGYALYAVMNAACGALVSKLEDLNAAMMPVTLLTVVSFYIGYIGAVAPVGGTLERVSLFIPFCAPFIAPFKLLNSNVAGRDIVISLLILLAAVILLACLSMRIYTASVLRYGKRLRLREGFKK